MCYCRCVVCRKRPELSSWWVRVSRTSRDVTFFTYVITEQAGVPKLLKVQRAVLCNLLDSALPPVMTPTPWHLIFCTGLLSHEVTTDPTLLINSLFFTSLRALALKSAHVPYGTRAYRHDHLVHQGREGPSFPVQPHRGGPGCLARPPRKETGAAHTVRPWPESCAVNCFCEEVPSLSWEAGPKAGVPGPHGLHQPFL